jgi:hypothetical protein
VKTLYIWLMNTWFQNSNCCCFLRNCFGAKNEDYDVSSCVLYLWHPCFIIDKTQKMECNFEKLNSTSAPCNCCLGEWRCNSTCFEIVFQCVEVDQSQAQGPLQLLDVWLEAGWVTQSGWARWKKKNPSPVRGAELQLYEYSLCSVATLTEAVYCS